MPKGRKKDGIEKGWIEEKVVLVYVASEGYVTRRTWCSHGRFSSLRVSPPPSPIHCDIHLSTSLVRRCVTAEMIRTCRNGETDALRRPAPLFRPMDHARIHFHGNLSRNLVVRARVYQIFLAQCIGMCLTLCIQ